MTILDIPDFPEGKKEKTSVPSDEQAWYGAVLSGQDTLSTFQSIRADIAFNGESALLDLQRQQYGEEQKAEATKTTAQILNDPTIDLEIKRNVLDQYMSNKDVDFDLRKRYRDQYAVAPIPDEANGLSVVEDYQDIIISTLNERDKIASDLQGDINRYMGSFNNEGVVSELLGSAFKDTLSSAATVTGSEHLKAGAEADAGLVGSTILGLARDVALPTGWLFNLETALQTSNTGGSAGDVFISAIFSGTGLDTLQQKYASLPLEDKRIFLSKIVESLEKTPGTDYNKFHALQQIALEGDMPAWRELVENVGSVLNIVGIGGFIRKGADLIHSGNIVGVKRNPVLPQPSPRGPAGTVNTASPSQAAQVGQKVLLEAAEGSGNSKTAAAMGTTPGEVIGGWSLPKLDDVQAHSADISESIAKLDRHFEDLYNETARNSSVVDVAERGKKVDEFLSFFSKGRGGVYQQANSTVEFGLFESRGNALYGKTNNYGFATRDEAEVAMKNMAIPEEASASLIEKQGQHYVQVDWKMKHDPLSQYAFGEEATNTSFFGMDVSGFANTVVGKWIFSPTTRLPEWVTKGAATTTLKASRAEGEFLKVVKEKIVPLRNNKKFASLLEETQENQKWFTKTDIRNRFPEASDKELNSILDGYAHYKRLVDYEYNWANRMDRAEKQRAGVNALYNNKDELIGYGNKVDTSDMRPNTMVWDYTQDAAVPLSKDQDVYKLLSARREGDEIYEYAVIGKEGSLPRNTLPKVEGYIPRRNIEKFYITSTPKKVTVNGYAAAGDLSKYSRVVGAARTQKEAEIYAAQLQRELGEDAIVSFKADRGNHIDAMLTDAEMYKELGRNSSKRGERLKTIDGYARLEDPLQSLTRTLRSMARLNAWDDYDTVFKKNFVKAYGDMTQGKFPNHVSEIHMPKNPSPATAKRYKDAQNLFEYKRDLNYRTTLSDDAWKYLLNNVGDVLEKTKYTGFQDVIRNSAQSGNPLVRGAKSLGSVLFLKLNPARQWIVQTQQQLELYTMNPSFASRAIRQTPGVFLGVMSKADKLATYNKALYETGRAVSGLGKDYDSIVDAVVKSGLPQSVDLNMMVQGIFGDVSRGIRESTGRRVWETAKGAASVPSNIGSKLGYGSAEFNNSLGTWLFARERWMKNNPNKEWNTPEAISKITGDAWDISHSMSTRAGALPYQDGALGLIFQFTAVQHKAFMQVFSSKTLSGMERAKLAAVRAILFGGKAGIPAGGAAYYMMQASDSPVMNEYSEQMKRGVSDWLLDNAIDMFINTPSGEIGEEFKKSDLNISSVLSPLPNTLPFLDFVIAAKNLADDIPYNNKMRLPFFGASGSVFEAIKDISNMYAVNEYDTVEALQMAGYELLESMSGVNNFAKYMMLKNFGDKHSKLGRNYGLNVIESNMAAQLFGIVTQEELDMFELKGLQKDRTDFVKSTADEIYMSLQKMNDKQKTVDDFYTYSSKLRTLLSFTDEDLRDEIMREVDKKARFNMQDNKTNIYNFILQHHKEKNDKYIRQMIEKLKESKDPRDQRELKRLYDEGIVNGNE